jgi:ADP-ribosylglycohydrolase
MEMVPCALAICVISGQDTKQAIIGATNIGRDADTIAGIAGELIGALYGIDALPTQWVDKVLKLNPNPDMELMARNLTNLIIERNKSQLNRSRKILTPLKE